MTQHAVFRADASRQIGGGHVARCLTLADKLLTMGWSCTLVTNKETKNFFPELNQSLHKIIFTSLADPLSKYFKSENILVIDHYQLDATFENSCRKIFKHIMVIDDLATNLHDCDLLLDQNPGRLHSDYAGLTSKHTQLFIGPHYALLDSNFASRRSDVLTRRRSPNVPPRILIMPGLTDPLCIAPRVLSVTSNTCPNSLIDIVLSSNAASIPKLKKMVLKTPSKVSLITDRKNIIDILSTADICIGAGGVSSLERCCLGLPSIIITIAKNQSLTAERLDFYGAAINLGSADLFFEDKLAVHLNDLSKNLNKRRSMSENGAQICDGRGVNRMACAINAL